MRKDRAHLVSDRGVEGPPDLVVEIAAPSTAGRDRGVKLDRYRLYGVPAYWVVDPHARTVEVWDLAERPDEPRVLSAEGTGADRTLRWRPVEGGPEVALEVGALLPAG